MDCKHFRKHHLAYLDDTLPGDLMAPAQRHILLCDGCAAHDTLVRRSLMVARSMPTIEPSAEFQSRLRARLAACREESAGERAPRARAARGSSARAAMVVAAGAMLGALAWQSLSETPVPELAVRPVITSPSAPISTAPYLTPALVQVMSTGNPMWPAAMMMEEAPAGFVNAEYSFADLR
ncbi:MAG: hypothetical protein ACK5AK_00920 [Gemmatimonas sp.]